MSLRAFAIMNAVSKGADYQFGDKYDKFQNKKQIFKVFFLFFAKFYLHLTFLRPKYLSFNTKKGENIWISRQMQLSLPR